MIEEFGSGEGFHASIYKAIAYNIIKTGNGSSPNLISLFQECWFPCSKSASKLSPWSRITITSSPLLAFADNSPHFSFSHFSTLKTLLQQPIPKRQPYNPTTLLFLTIITPIMALYTPKRKYHLILLTCEFNAM